MADREVHLNLKNSEYTRGQWVGSPTNASGTYLWRGQAAAWHCLLQYVVTTHPLHRFSVTSIERSFPHCSHAGQRWQVSARTDCGLSRLVFMSIWIDGLEYVVRILEVTSVGDESVSGEGQLSKRPW